MDFIQYLYFQKRIELNKYIYIYIYTLDRIKRPFRFFFNDPLIKVFDTTKKSSPEKIIEIGADFRVAP